MKVLIVEDDEKISAFVSKGLRESGFSVDQVYTGEEGYIMLKSNSYDAAIMDIMMPGELNGLQVIEKMRDNSIKTPVLILSAKRSVDDRIIGFQKGGDDYITKPFSFAELLARLQALIRRSTMADTSTELHYKDLSLNLLTREVKRGEQIIECQPREFSFLEYFIRNQGIVLSKTLIMEHIWEYNFDPQTNVVDVLVCRLRNKIDKEFDEKLIHTIRGVGYVLK
ncbi:response regulator transcription factor [Thiospirochaeta perfilievii]|uniref:Response regulator transcription factor n=1 Tax=Thiospirochaeta perfilievii TaxID=252967 RepID=A0A5C1QEP3_9SPIO|nr:response regulator transcription factor [Thiospirochaeta perfilievii]QEN05540.1 response regulator transcription factor [Thiospirochaeta perfilievii]